MMFLIVLALAAVAQAAPQYANAIPTVFPDGHIADTPEVAIAKIAHYYEHAKALAGVPASSQVYSQFAAPAAVASPYYKSYSGPIAVPTVLPDGHIADTPEVAAAKVAHFSEHAKALASDAAPSQVYSQYAAPAAVATSPYYKSYSGPIAVPTVLPDGHIADTPEVAAAKYAHFSEHAKALASAPAPSQVYSQYAAPAAVASPYYKSFYSGSLAIPTVLPDGHLADTPEVAAAKAFHYNEHVKALSSSSF